MIGFLPRKVISSCGDNVRQVTQLTRMWWDGDSPKWTSEAGGGWPRGFISLTFSHPQSFEPCGMKATRSCWAAVNTPWSSESNSMKRACSTLCLAAALQQTLSVWLHIQITACALLFATQKLARMSVLSPTLWSQ